MYIKDSHFTFPSFIIILPRTSRDRSPHGEAEGGEVVVEARDGSKNHRASCEAGATILAPCGGAPKLPPQLRRIRGKDSGISTRYWRTDYPGCVCFCVCMRHCSFVRMFFSICMRFVRACGNPTPRRKMFFEARECNTVAWFYTVYLVRDIGIRRSDSVWFNAGLFLLLVLG